MLWTQADCCFVDGIESELNSSGTQTSETSAMETDHEMGGVKPCLLFVVVFDHRVVLILL